MGQVPVYIEYDSGGKSQVITQSLAIIEYLQEKYPQQGFNVLTNDINHRVQVRYIIIIKPDINPSI